MNLFRVRGIQLAVHSSFFLLLAYFGWQGWAEGHATGTFWSIATLLAFFACVVLHELGHSFTAMHFGVNVRRILLMPIGGMAEFDSIPRQPSREILITLAGPAVNFVIAGCLWWSVRRLPDTVPDFSLAGLTVQLFAANIIMGCFNMLPAFPMDGGRILRAFLATRTTYLKATRWAAVVGKVLCVIGVVVAIFAPELHIAASRGVILALLFAFIFFAGEMEYRAVERRELEDAHWREMLARIYGTRGPIDEPPVLSP